ncbi:uncharacterized protein [Rutidosis leptorrhynchoides]|uniref:uncharacterized protein n=1 Tax=Rutidosis leptorrhynchoides TaxID=125765 RepID=UPI003A99A99A
MSLNIRGVGQDGKLNWLQKLCRMEKPWILCLQETKSGEIEDRWFHKFWGSVDYKYIEKYAEGFSGGMITIWDSNIFNVNQAVEGEYLLAIKGHFQGYDTEVAVVNVYGPHTTAKKIRCWSGLESLLSYGDIPWIICGDFNDVREPSERFNSVFKQNWAGMFNQFINNNCLIEIPLGGKKYTRICDNGVKFSKLDRFLISEETQLIWPNLSATTLDKHLSDHCSIILRNGSKDFGPKPTLVFNEWLRLEEAEKVIIEAWNIPATSVWPDCVFRDKLKNVKVSLKRHSSSLNNLEEQILQHSKAASE